MMKKKKNNKGFSLVELIVVIAIMAVLVGVLAPQFIKYVESSRQSTDMQNVQQLKTAIEVYCADAENAPEVTITFKASVTGGSIDTVEASVDPETTAKSFTLKSNGWSDGSYKFTPSTGAWDKTSDPVGTNANGGTSAKNMDDVF